MNNDIWEYGYIYLDHQSTSISVSIYQKDNTAPNDTQEMAAIFQKLTDYVYSWKDTHNGYNDYALEIFFHAKFAFYSSNYYFKIKTIDSSLHETEIDCKWISFSFNEIAKYFPNTTKLTYRSYFDDITQIKGFDNLLYLSVPHQLLTEEEKVYILSLYPACQIEDISTNSNENTPDNP